MIPTTSSTIRAHDSYKIALEDMVKCTQCVVWNYSSQLVKKNCYTAYLCFYKPIITNTGEIASKNIVTNLSKITTTSQILSNVYS